MINFIIPFWTHTDGSEDDFRTVRIWKQTAETTTEVFIAMNRAVGEHFRIGRIGQRVRAKNLKVGDKIRGGIDCFPECRTIKGISETTKGIWFEFEETWARKFGCDPEQWVSIFIK